MINTYKQYLNRENILTFQDMEFLHNDLIIEIVNDEEALELYNELIDDAIRYSQIRAKWINMNNDEKKNIDATRTCSHNALITDFNILSRYLKLKGKNTFWKEKLGDDRKLIGDFACYIVFINSIKSRALSTFKK